MQVDETLVDAHLPSVECVCALTARRLAHAETENLRGQTHRACNVKLLLTRASDEVAADLLQGLDVPSWIAQRSALKWRVGHTSSHSNVAHAFPRYICVAE